MQIMNTPDAQRDRQILATLEEVAVDSKKKMDAWVDEYSHYFRPVDFLQKTLPQLLQTVHDQQQDNVSFEATLQALLSVARLGSWGYMKKATGAKFIQDPQVDQLCGSFFDTLDVVAARPLNNKQRGQIKQFLFDSIWSAGERHNKGPNMVAFRNIIGEINSDMKRNEDGTGGMGIKRRGGGAEEPAPGARETKMIGPEIASTMFQSFFDTFYRNFGGGNIANYTALAAFEKNLVDAKTLTAAISAFNPDTIVRTEDKPVASDDSIELGGVGGAMRDVLLGRRGTVEAGALKP